MKNFNQFDGVALAVLVVGGINWGMIGAFNIDLVSLVFGEMTIVTRVVYALVGVSALYVAFTALLYIPSPISNSRVVHP